MNSLPYKLEARAEADLAEVSVVLRPAVLEQLARVSANHATCSQPAVFPHPAGYESALWCRLPAGRAALIQVLFDLSDEEDRLLVSRILLRDFERLPPWATDPIGWGNVTPWPVVDL